MNYPAYLKETLSLSVLEDPEGRGFVTYGFNSIPGLSLKHCYIQDLYVEPKHRKGHVAARMADEVAELAKKEGYGLLFGSVSKHSNKPEQNVRVLEAYGMKLYAVDADTSWYFKELT